MSNKLKENQLLAIPLVAQGVSGKDIASRLKVAEETVSRWKKLPEFKAEVNQLLKECREETQHKLRSIVHQSLEIIKSELEND
ncbi:helix-turn-helix domain-containing protein, partial [Alphaproteobacteria bacterium]|nr:helix-turn-helix domain-containing protein [Alphaproteobacteria bacterium]